MVKTARQVFKRSMKASRHLGLERVRVALRGCNEGAVWDALDMRPDGNACHYYRWTMGLVKEFKPKQVIELGGAMGVWDIMVLQQLPKDSKLYSITLEEDGLEFSYVVDGYPNFHPVVGDDLDLSNWEGVDLRKTDLWFFDALHTEEHLRKELDLYLPFLKKGAIVLIDDIHSFGLEPVWKDVQEMFTSCYDATDPLHHSGFGVCVV